jgi:hypothetical protein
MGRSQEGHYRPYLQALDTNKMLLMALGLEDEESKDLKNVGNTTYFYMVP